MTRMSRYRIPSKTRNAISKSKNRKARDRHETCSVVACNDADNAFDDGKEPMNILDELKRKDEEARKMLIAEVESVAIKIDELTTYRNSLYAEMKRRGYIFDTALAPTTNEPSSIAVVPVKSEIVRVSKDEPSLPERILGLLSDGVPRSFDEVFIAISGKPGLHRSTVCNRLQELKNQGKIATMPNSREGAQPGSLLYVIPKQSEKPPKIEAANARVDNPESADDVEFRRTVVPKYVKQLENKSICGAIRKAAVDGIPRTGRELFALVSPEMPNVEFASFRACINKAGLCSGPSGGPRKERIFWLPKDETALPSATIVQAPIDESDYPVDKLIWRLMSDGKPRTKSEIYEYVLRFNKTATAAIVTRQIVRLGIASEMNGPVRVYRSRIAGNGT